jgi:hypothetical protein
VFVVTDRNWVSELLAIFDATGATVGGKRGLGALVRLQPYGCRQTAIAALPMS